jgi:hypothetical protein
MNEGGSDMQCKITVVWVEITFGHNTVELKIGCGTIYKCMSVRTLCTKSLLTFYNSFSYIFYV